MDTIGQCIVLFLETRKIKVEVPDKEGAVYTTQWLWRYVVFVTHSFREYAWLRDAAVT